MERANKAFYEYNKCLIRESAEDKAIAWTYYQVARNAITKDVYMSEHKRWISCIRDNDPKCLWKKIDWKGNMSEIFF